MLKPLGRKAYGSIPHLPKSRIGPGDHFCHEGQQTILTVKARDKHDRIIVTEKLDGACVAVARINGVIVALSRAGYTADSAKYEHLNLFGVWVRANALRFDYLPEGHRICGEWLAMAHSTRYELRHPPFVPFDLMAGDTRLPHDEMVALSRTAELTHAHVLHDGPPLSVEAALKAVGESGHHGALDLPEGAVWRCERKGQFDFIAKFVRHDKQDGHLLPNISGQPPIWHWRP